MVNWEEEFPMLKHWIFLDAANTMIPARYWLKEMRECLNFYETASYGPVDHPFLAPVFNECIKRSAKLIHAKKSEITNIYRVMTAANLIINDLIKWKKGDNVVFSDLDYPSIPFILMHLQNRMKIELRRIKNVNGEIMLSDIEKNIDDNTKLVNINRTTPWSGFTYDVKEVCRIAHEHNSLVLDDSIQDIGAINVDVHRDDVDFLLTGSYKWQCGPEGAGIFYIKEELIEKFEPVFRNYIWSDIPEGIPFSRPNHDNIESWNYPLVKNANRFNMGVCVLPILFGWNATLKFYEKIGIKNVEENVRKLGDYCISRLQEAGCRVLTPEDPEKRHGLIVYTTGSYENDLKVFEKLDAPWTGMKPIKVSHRGIGGVIGIRVSCHFFNTKDDIDALIEAQEKIIKE
jgi:selenocysteine lyase/cysteine desulfurase